MTDRKKPGVAFWATVVLFAVLDYIASVGPAQYLAAHQLLPAWTIEAGQWLYLPLALLRAPINGWPERYADWFAHALPWIPTSVAIPDIPPAGRGDPRSWTCFCWRRTFGK